MWNYEKRLQYPVKITKTNPKLAQVIISQFGGPDGELAASMRYLSQRYTMPYKEVTGILTDIGTEELAHMEMICAIVYQLTKDLSPEEIENAQEIPAEPEFARLCRLPDGNKLCDYASAGNRFTPENTLRVWLPKR